jgi:hypothetical protein
MSQPVLNVSLEEIKKEILHLIEWLKKTSVRRQSWATPLLVFAQEFQALANMQPLDPTRIRDLTSRLRQHIIDHLLKGFDDVVWHAEALEHLANEHNDA